MLILSGFAKREICYRNVPSLVIVVCTITGDKAPVVLNSKLDGMVSFSPLISDCNIKHIPLYQQTNQ